MSMRASLYQVNPATIGLDGKECGLFNRLLYEWGSHLNSNLRNEAYYNFEKVVQNLERGLPEQMRGMRAVVGWPAKAVDALAARSVFMGFTSDGSAAEDLGDVVRANDLRELYRQAVTSQLMHS